MLTSALVGLIAIALLAGYLKGETPEERETRRQGRFECSYPEIIAGTRGDSDRAGQNPPC